MSMATKKQAPKKDVVHVKFLPKDPLVARRDGLWPLDRAMVYPTAGSGPCGPHAVVVDYNADLDVRFAPARLQRNGSFAGLARLSREKLLADFHFHQVNVWAIVERTLEKIEHIHLLGRAIPWANRDGRLLLLPHAGYSENAFYDRGTGGIHFFYFEGFEGKPVFTCLSHDIITHELGHAVLDGLKPGYNEVSSPETAGFHEYFGDAVAMMASLSTRETAFQVVKDAPEKLDAHNVVSAIASEFGAALRGLPDEDYLRGAWNQRTMESLVGTFEEHDWSEVLTGIYYDLLQYLYRRFYKDNLQRGGETALNKRQGYAMGALMQAATSTAGVMFRAIDYCPPVDLRYADYAEAVLRAQEVAYPVDDLGIRAQLVKLFTARGIPLRKPDEKTRDAIQRALRAESVAETATTPADAYRFLDLHRAVFGIPYEANLAVNAVYRTNKHTPSGYRPPKEHIVEFTWSEDVALEGKRFGALDGTMLPLWCGGTLVFDTNSNFLHRAMVLPTEQRKRELKAYAAYLVEAGELAMAPDINGNGAPSTGHARVRATVANGRVSLCRIAAMRHARGGGEA
ncbi:hypothetical protein LYSHEL_00190 [Lysobacter helvus]|uniref:Serine protease n=2 Tax=Lysobacter helvus TaxID=2675059 RepID=A0ABM7Q9K7_9GAMM|nr:hypothetical protein LYSHEL_00190 [Lysobacter helvus]